MLESVHEFAVVLCGIQGGEGWLARCSHAVHGGQERVSLPGSTARRNMLECTHQTPLHLERLELDHCESVLQDLGLVLCRGMGCGH